jgi:hypothetical protein
MARAGASCALRPIRVVAATGDLEQLPPDGATWAQFPVGDHVVRGWGWRFRHLRAYHPGTADIDLLVTTFVEASLDEDL